ncbi:hypothetical protein Leryth_017580 [Lithospermum erythrorhizon]|nr:hypothetical protein Leryth_017580 [Lithospermum erythrorhizon]
MFSSSNSSMSIRIFSSVVEKLRSHCIIRCFWLHSWACCCYTELKIYLIIINMLRQFRF